MAAQAQTGDGDGNGDGPKVEITYNEYEKITRYQTKMKKIHLTFYNTKTSSTEDHSF